MSYTQELTKAMELCASRGAIFVGQGVGYPSTIQTDTLRSVSESQRIEFPVAEDLQMGFCIGLAMTGKLPVSVYPRWDFLLLAANQLVLHLDRLKYMQDARPPKVLIRVVAPSTDPFDPGPQHDGDHGAAARLLLRNIPIVHLAREEDVMREWARALDGPISVILVEYGKYYDAVPSGVMK